VIRYAKQFRSLIAALFKKEHHCDQCVIAAEY
jgi:hypothetical protein